MLKVERVQSTTVLKVEVCPAVGNVAQHDCGPNGESLLRAIVLDVGCGQLPFPLPFPSPSLSLLDFPIPETEPAQRRCRPMTVGLDCHDLLVRTMIGPPAYTVCVYIPEGIGRCAG